MIKEEEQQLWIAVRVERGFVVEVKAYRSYAPARRRELSWRRRMNPDYDETGVLPVTI